VRTPDATVEARGVLCPVPIIRLARAAAALPADSLIELRTDDPAAEFDVPAWCRLRGHHLVLTEPLAADADGPGADGAEADGADGSVTTTPEPHAPNANPGQALRHVIRLGGPPGPPGPA
jgi:tRNA 2-thiouridine synthesizing protein A